MKGISLILLLLYVPISMATDFLARPEVTAFIEKMNQKHGFQTETLRGLFAQVRPNTKVLNLTTRPAEALTWDRYQRLLINQQRIQDGAAFWREHADVLTQLEVRYGVPADIIVAIMGIESSYGKRQAIYPTFETLATLAFEFKRRQSFFQQELENFLLLAQEQRWEHPLSIKGSYCGAIGSPQFMPSSYRRYAVSYTHSSRDLFYNVHDALASIANYMAEHGWQRGQPIVYQADIAPKEQAPLELIAKTHSSPKPQHYWSELKALGVRTAAAVAYPGKLALLQFKNKESVEHWLGCKNFYVITRYNQSNNYGMAVYLLAQKIQAYRAKHT